jgi:hypothetical protein
MKKNGDKRACAMMDCDTVAGGGLILFAFPGNDQLRKKWMASSPRDWVKEKINLKAAKRCWACELHFDEAFVIRGAKRLRRGAYPTRNLGGGKPDAVPTPRAAGPPAHKSARGRPKKHTTPKSKGGSGAAAPVQPLHRPKQGKSAPALVCPVPEQGPALHRRSRSDARSGPASKPHADARLTDVVFRAPGAAGAPAAGGTSTPIVTVSRRRRTIASEQLR